MPQNSILQLHPLLPFPHSHLVAFKPISNSYLTISTCSHPPLCFPRPVLPILSAPTTLLTCLQSSVEPPLSPNPSSPLLSRSGTPSPPSLKMTQSYTLFSLATYPPTLTNSLFLCFHVAIQYILLLNLRSHFNQTLIHNLFIPQFSPFLIISITFAHARCILLFRRLLNILYTSRSAQGVLLACFIQCSFNRKCQGKM